MREDDPGFATFCWEKRIVNKTPLRNARSDRVVDGFTKIF
jgi:hypothetical protein